MAISLSAGRFGWECQIPLRSWSSVCKTDASGVHTVLCSEDGGIDLTSPASPAQLAAVEDLIAHEATTFDAVFTELRRYYDRVRPKYLAFFARLPAPFAVDAEAVMPGSPDATTFGALFDLRTVAVQPSSRDGISFITYLFSAEWEVEHGIGAVAHRREVITIGYGSDLMLWSPPDE